MSNKENPSDFRNFRMLYYEQLGLRNVDQMKALEHLLKEDPLDVDKIKTFTQQYLLPSVYRVYVWKVLLGIIPVYKESVDFVTNHRNQQFLDLKQALITMKMVSPCSHSPKTAVLAILLEHGNLSILHNTHVKYYAMKVYILNSISEITFQLTQNETDTFWIAKEIIHAQEMFLSVFAKLPYYVNYYLQVEDQRLFQHLSEIQLFKMLPYEKWFQTYFASVFAKSSECLNKIWDKLIAGSCHILVFVCVSLLLTYSIQLKELNCDKALKYVNRVLPQEDGQSVVDKAIELWEQHRKELTAKLATHS
ncbi:TBC1 domain family member 7 [Hydra vulgaris]|uniref:TBC1 domain family member 7 n=1 Tax=Hydra vulgaris TaxID=6087 RepID=A0ABM4CSR1_HYDVU